MNTICPIFLTNPLLFKGNFILLIILFIEEVVTDIKTFFKKVTCTQKMILIKKIQLVLLLDIYRQQKFQQFNIMVTTIHIII